MIPVNEATLCEQRQTVRHQLLVQRQQIARQLDSQSDAGSYPRSMTMRFLTGKSALGSKLLMNAASLLGKSMVKSLALSLLISTLAKRKHR